MVKLHSINTGNFALDGGSMFGVVPRTLWQKTDPPDELNRITLANRVLFIRDGERKILVDAGIGNYSDEKFLGIYRLSDPNYDLNNDFALLGECTDTLTDVVLTHLHFDHAGGIVTRHETTQIAPIAPTFPQACLWVQRSQWQWALNPSPRDRGSYLETYLDFLKDSPRLELLDGPGRISDHVTVQCFQGHTPGLQGVLVETAEETCFFAGDLIPLASHVRVPSIMAFDDNPIITAREKEQILQRACAEHWLVYFQHDPRTEKAYIARKKDKFVLASPA